MPSTEPIVEDKYKLDMEKFKLKSGKPPPSWKKTLQANAVITDEMRTLLEFHYDDVHLQRWRKKHAGDQQRAPERRGAYKVFSSVSHAQRRRLNQAMELPTAIKCILQCPEDEH